MDYFWDNPGGDWIERGVDAQGRIGQFEPAGGRAPRHRLADAARLAGARTGRCACASRYPAFFQFCPNCGQPLDNAADTASTWFGSSRDARLPRHVPQGLPVAVIGEPGAQLRMPAPPNAESTFASACFGHAAPSLLAMAPRRGVLQYWDPCAHQWLLLEGPGDIAYTQSRHAWLPASGDGIVLPCRDGLGLLSLDLLNERYRLDVLVAGACAASPGELHGQFIVPMRVEEGIAFTDGIVPGAPHGGFQSPFSYDGCLWWLHGEGLLRFHPARGGQWLPWPNSWRPCLSLCGPTASRDGRLWLCGHDGVAYSFLELGAVEPDRKAVDGLRAGWSNFLFRRGHEVRGEPWDEPDVDDPHQDDSLVIPLLRAFNSDRARPSGLVLRLSAHAGRAEDLTMAMDAHIEWIGASNRVLDRCTRLPAPFDITAFVHEGCVWLHHPAWSLMRGWRLAP